MITQCPHCQQQFRLTDEQVENSQGMVRCGHCMRAFDLELSKAYSASLADGNFISERHLRSFVSTQNNRSANPSDLNEGDKLPEYQEPSLNPDSSDRIEPKMESGDFQTGEEGTYNLAGYGKDSYQQNHYRKTHLGTWLVYCFGIPVCVLLVLGILLQLGLIDHQYTRSAALDPICKILKCGRKENSFSIQFSDLRPHSSRQNALVMESIIKNNSGEERAYPALRLKLINAGKRISAERTFTSKDYAPWLDSQEKIPAGKSIPVTLEIIEPATPINGYQLVVQSAQIDSTKEQ